MGKQILNGVVYGNQVPYRELTKAEYDALPNSKYTDGIMYYIRDVSSPDNFGTAHKYSTDEQIVGTWIDGKPLYEKVLNLTSVQIADNNYSDSDIQYADHFEIVSGHYIVSGAYGNIGLGLNSYESNSLYTRTGFRIYNKTLYTVINGYTAVSAKIIIQYTKTTD